MKTQRRFIADFEARSVVLFSALTLACAADVQAQSPAPPPGRPAAQMSSPTAQATAGGQEAAAAFGRADANQDGRLSAKEAELLPAVAQRFEMLDGNRDGFLSREEFEKGLKP